MKVSGHVFVSILSISAIFLLDFGTVRNSVIFFIFHFMKTILEKKFIWLFNFYEFILELLSCSYLFKQYVIIIIIIIIIIMK